MRDPADDQASRVCAEDTPEPVGGGLGARTPIGGHSGDGKGCAGSRRTASFGSTPEVAARPLAWCPGCWLRARVRSWGCATAAVEGAPVEREAGGGLEVRLRCFRRAGAPVPGSLRGAGWRDLQRQAVDSSFLHVGKDWGLRDVGAWSVVLGLLRPWSSWALACPVHGPPPAASHYFTQFPLVSTANYLPQTQNQPWV